MKTPRKAAEITHAWLETILTEYEARQSPGATVQVTSYQVMPGAKPGENFGSEVAKVRVEGLARGTSRASESTTYNLFAKFLVGTALDRESVKVMKIHARELLIYSDIIAELNEFQAKHGEDKYRINVPELVYGICTKDDYVVVMKDISSVGYANEDNRVGLDLPHILKIVESTARLHAVSYACYQSDHFYQKYPDFIVDKKLFAKMLLIILEVFYDGLTKAAEREKDKYEPLLVKMLSNKKAILEKICDMIAGDEPSKLSCLAHGDLWSNNFMFLNEVNNSGESLPVDVMLVDWSNTMLRDPLLDLQYLIHTSTTLSLRRSHLEEMLRHYHATFTTATTDMGAQVDNWEFEDFMAEWRRTRVFGSFMGVMVNMITVGRSGKDFKRDSISSNKFIANIQISLARAVIPIMLKIATTPVMISMGKKALKKSFKPMLKELELGNNEVLQTRVFDILTDACDNGVMDV